MLGRLESKTAIVLATEQEILRATAKSFIKKGVFVISTDINENHLSCLKDCYIRSLNLLDSKSIKENGAIDILFNCTGYVNNGTILDCDKYQWDYPFNLNVKGSSRIIRVLLIFMINKGEGFITKISSIASSVMGVLNRGVYKASNETLIGFKKSLTVYFITQEIRCNTVYPVTIGSISLRERMKATGNYEGAVKGLTKQLPMRRLSYRSEPSSLVTYFANGLSAYTTGQMPVIDGQWII